MTLPPQYTTLDERVQREIARRDALQSLGGGGSADVKNLIGKLAQIGGGKSIEQAIQLLGMQSSAADATRARSNAEQVQAEAARQNQAAELLGTQTLAETTREHQQTLAENARAHDMDATAAHNRDLTSAIDALGRTPGSDTGTTMDLLGKAYPELVPVIAQHHTASLQPEIAKHLTAIDAFHQKGDTAGLATYMSSLGNADPEVTTAIQKHLSAPTTTIPAPIVSPRSDAGAGAFIGAGLNKLPGAIGRGLDSVESGVTNFGSDFWAGLLGYTPAKIEQQKLVNAQKLKELGFPPQIATR